MHRAVKKNSKKSTRLIIGIQRQTEDKPNKMTSKEGIAATVVSGICVIIDCPSPYIDSFFVLFFCFIVID
jgi:hypothetical protein